MVCSFIAGKGASAALLAGRSVISIDNDVTLTKSALRSAISSGISRIEGSDAEECDENEQNEEENENNA